VPRSLGAFTLPPVPLDAVSYPLDLQGLAAVTIGTSLHQPVMHRVSADLYHGSQLACRKLRGKGCHRIGMVLTPSINERVEGKWLGAYLAEQALWPEADRLPPLLVASSASAAFYRWLARHKPDAILIAEPDVEEWLGRRTGRERTGPAPLTAWLRTLEGMRPGAPAIDTRPEKMGAAAVELVVGQIHRNERGSPESPNTLLLEGVWRE
jgi:hypothetical protein